MKAKKKRSKKAAGVVVPRRELWCLVRHENYLRWFPVLSIECRTAVLPAKPARKRKEARGKAKK